MTEPGQTLAGRYRIESVLGQGGMGAVYLASMEALGGKKVAIKEMELRGFNERELAAAVKQFQSEARFLANLDHPNLVQVTDFFVEGDKHYLVMAYVAGQTLQQKLRARGKPFPWGQVQEWARPLCAVLTYLHSQDPPILFRDLKPSNIMVEDSGRLRLIDFGIARTGQEGERTSTFLQGTGTSGFSPLEQYGGGQSTDHRSDIYSLGATLYQLLTGRVPPDAVSRVSQGTAVVEPTTLAPDLPKALDGILLKALAQNKADRHQSVAELAAELAGVIQGSESETEDLRPAGIVAASPATGGARTQPSASNSAYVSSSQASSVPNITVELMPSGPTTTPLQMAAGLGAAAVITLLLGSMLMSRDPATAAASSSKTPAAPPPLTQVNKEPVAKTPGEKPVEKTVEKASPGKPTASSETRVRPAADEGPPPGNRVQQVRTVAAQVREQVPQVRPARAVVKRVVSAAVDSRSDVPTAPPRRTQTTNLPEAREPLEQPSTAAAPPPPPPQFEPPPVPEGMPTPKLKDKYGRYLPPDQQGPGFPGARLPLPGPPMGPDMGAAPDGDVLNYETRRRR